MNALKAAATVMGLLEFARILTGHLIVHVLVAILEMGPVAQVKDIFFKFMLISRSVSCDHLHYVTVVPNQWFKTTAL